MLLSSLLFPPPGSEGVGLTECLVLLYDDLTRPSAPEPPVFFFPEEVLVLVVVVAWPGEKIIRFSARSSSSSSSISDISLILLFGKERKKKEDSLCVCVFFSRLKSSLLRGTFTAYKQLLSSFCVYILYYVYVYITEKRNKTSSRELLLLLKSDESATEMVFLLESFSR